MDQANQWHRWTSWIIAAAVFAVWPSTLGTLGRAWTYGATLHRQEPS